MSNNYNLLKHARKVFFLKKLSKRHSTKNNYMEEPLNFRTIGKTHVFITFLKSLTLLKNTIQAGRLFLNKTIRKQIESWMESFYEISVDQKKNLWRDSMSRLTLSRNVQWSAESAAVCVNSVAHLNLSSLR